MKFTFNFKSFNFKCFGYFKFFIWKEKVRSNSSVLVVFGGNKFTEGIERHSNVKVVMKKKLTEWLLQACTDEVDILSKQDLRMDRGMERD